MSNLEIKPVTLPDAPTTKAAIEPEPPISEALDVAQVLDEPEPEPAKPEPRVWPVPSEAAIAAYHRALQAAQLHWLNFFAGTHDSEMLDKQLMGAHQALRAAWKVWQQTAEPLSSVDAANLLRQAGRNDLAEYRFGVGVATMTIVGYEGPDGLKSPVYGFMGNTTEPSDQDKEMIRQAWRAKVQEDFRFVLKRLAVYGFASDDLRLAFEATLP